MLYLVSKSFIRATSTPYIRLGCTSLVNLDLVDHNNKIQDVEPQPYIMADQMAYLLFGDQSLDTHGFLADFCRQGSPSILAKTFLHQAGAALREEIDRLPRLERQKIPIFRTLQQLNTRYHAQTIKYPGIDSALLCITQLAHYIEYASGS